MATTTLDELSVKFTADMSGFKSQLEKIEVAVLKVAATTDKASKRMTSSFNSFGRFLKFDVLARYGQQLIRLETQQEELAAAIKDTADRANIGTESLQRLQRVVDQNGGSAEGLNTALIKLQKSIGEFKSGSADKRDIFEALGLDKMIDNGASTEQVFYGLATAVSKLKSEEQAAAIIAKIMGKEGDALVETLKKGGPAAAEMASKVKNIIPDETIQKLDQANDKTQEFNALWSKWGTEGAAIFVDSVKWFGDLANAVDTVTGASKELRKQWEWLSANNFFGGGDGGGKFLTGVPGVFGGRALDDAAAKAKGNGSWITRPGAIDAFAAKRGLGAVTPDQDKVNSLFSPPKGDKRDEAAEATKRYLEVIEDLNFATEQLVRTEQEAAFQEELRNRLSAAGVVLDSERGEVIEELTAQYISQKQAGEDLAKMWEVEAANANRAIAEMNEEIRKAAEEWEDFQDQAGDAVATAFADAIIYGEELEQVFARLLQQLAEMIFQKYVFDAISGASGGGIGGVIGSVLGRAGGGPVNQGKPYMVGEHGPELFVPNMSGGIVPSGRSGGSSFSYAPTIYAPGADASTLATMRTMLAHQKQDILSMMPKVIKESTARGRLSSMR